MMLLNIPRSYTRDKLQSEVDDLGFVGRYNFMHLPTDASLSGNMGHATINFIRPEDAVRFRFKLTGYMFKGGRGKRPANVALAKIQGLQEHLRVNHKTGPMKRDGSWCLPTVVEGSFKKEYEYEDDHEATTSPGSGCETPSTVESTPVTSYPNAGAHYTDRVRGPPGLEALGGSDDPFRSLPLDNNLFAARLHQLASLDCMDSGNEAPIPPRWSPPPAPSVDDLLSLKTQLAAKLQGMGKQKPRKLKVGHCAAPHFNDFEPAYVTCCPAVAPRRA